MRSKWPWGHRDDGRAGDMDDPLRNAPWGSEGKLCWGALLEVSMTWVPAGMMASLYRDRQAARQTEEKLRKRIRNSFKKNAVRSLFRICAYVVYAL